MNDKGKRIDIFRENHIGFGVRWTRDWRYQFEISIALPFITITLGFGKEA